MDIFLSLKYVSRGSAQYYFAKKLLANSQRVFCAELGSNPKNFPSLVMAFIIFFRSKISSICFYSNRCFGLFRNPVVSLPVQECRKPKNMIIFYLPKFKEICKEEVDMERITRIVLKCTSRENTATRGRSPNNGSMTSNSDARTGSRQNKTRQGLPSILMTFLGIPSSFSISMSCIWW